MDSATATTTADSRHLAQDRVFQFQLHSPRLNLWILKCLFNILDWATQNIRRSKAIPLVPAILCDCSLAQNLV